MYDIWEELCTWSPLTTPPPHPAVFRNSACSPSSVLKVKRTFYYSKILIVVDCFMSPINWPTTHRGTLVVGANSFQLRQPALQVHWWGQQNIYYIAISMNDKPQSQYKEQTTRETMTIYHLFLWVGFCSNVQ